MLLDTLTEEEKDAVLAEVGYSRKQLDSDLEHIKDWLKLQHHLPPSRLKESDTFLINYLTGCKGSLEKVKRKLDAYYTLRSHSEIFDCRDPLDRDYVIMSNIMFLAQSPRLANGKLVRPSFSGGLPDADRQNASFISYIRRFVSTCELWLRESSCSVKYCTLLDAKEIKASDLVKVNPLFIKDLLYYLLEALPIRYTRIYVINTPSYLASFINTIVIPFLPKKHKQRLYVTVNGFEEVSQFFDKSVLPRDYGGDLPPLRELSDILMLGGRPKPVNDHKMKQSITENISDAFHLCRPNHNNEYEFNQLVLYPFWSEKGKERRQWFLNELSERCDESKRITPQDPTNPYFGVPGSLKKLVVD